MGNACFVVNGKPFGISVNILYLDGEVLPEHDAPYLGLELGGNNPQKLPCFPSFLGSTSKFAEGKHKDYSYLS